VRFRNLIFTHELTLTLMMHIKPTFITLPNRRFARYAISAEMRSRKFSRCAPQRGQGHLPEDGAVAYGEAPKLQELVTAVENRSPRVIGVIS